MKKKAYLVAVRAPSEKTGKLKTKIFAFGDRGDRDSFTKECRDHGAECLTSEDELEEEEIANTSPTCH